MSMKKLFFLMTAIAIFASCNQNEPKNNKNISVFGKYYYSYLGKDVSVDSFILYYFVSDDKVYRGSGPSKLQINIQTTDTLTYIQNNDIVIIYRKDGRVNTGISYGDSLIIENRVFYSYTDFREIED